MWNTHLTNIKLLDFTRLQINIKNYKYIKFVCLRVDRLDWVTGGWHVLAVIVTEVTAELSSELKKILK